MRRSRRWIWAAVVVIAVLGLGFLIAPDLEWATPFSVPSHFTYRGLEYGSEPPFYPEPTCVEQLPERLRRGYLPAHRIGTIAGFFTSSKPILQPKEPGWTAEQVAPHPVRLLVPDGDCLRIYMETADLG